MQDFQMKPGERLCANCQECSLQLSGDFSELKLKGKDNFVTLRGHVSRIEIEGSHNQVECLESPQRVVLKGQGNRVRISERPGSKRPEIVVDGSDQGVTYRPLKAQ